MKIHSRDRTFFKRCRTETKGTHISKLRPSATKQRHLQKVRPNRMTLSRLTNINTPTKYITSTIF
ncbi:hypothetical protein HanIR_Chr16g0806081 [Helianthus annuus]|nr:hypothetical protein HanIR_Chr16g0806081 [Helianthus annuus]